MESTDQPSDAGRLIELVLFVDVSPGMDMKNLMGFATTTAPVFGNTKRYRISAWIPDPNGPYTDLPSTVAEVAEDG
jgi:hypothetical protein